MLTQIRLRRQIRYGKGWLHIHEQTVFHLTCEPPVKYDTEYRLPCMAFGECSTYSYSCSQHNTPSLSEMFLCDPPFDTTIIIEDAHATERIYGSIDVLDTDGEFKNIDISNPEGVQYGELRNILDSTRASTGEDATFHVFGSQYWKKLPKDIDSLTGWKTLEILLAKREKKIELLVDWYQPAWTDSPESRAADRALFDRKETAESQLEW